MTEPNSTDPAPTEDISVEDASDADLRVWARDNGIEGVPGSGRLSAAWREQITEAMAAALDPKEEGSVKTTSAESFTSSETKTQDGEETSSPTEEAEEYRSVWEAPETWVSGQTFTA